MMIMDIGIPRKSITDNIKCSSPGYYELNSIKCGVMSVNNYSFQDLLSSLLLSRYLYRLKQTEL